MAEHNTTVEMFYSGTWNTVPVFTDDSINLSRGTSGEGQEAPPSTASLTLDNRTGDYNPKNPSSPLYGLVGRNTPIRVLTGAAVSEDFEDGVLNVSTANSGSASWFRTNAKSHAGSWSMRSGAITHSQFSTLTITVPADKNMVSFWYKVSTEEGFDFFTVRADSDLKLQTSGEIDWTFIEFSVEDVTSVVLTYTKDTSVSEGDDAVYIDDLKFVNVRSTTEASSWKPQRNVKGNVAWTPVEGGGLLRRLGQGASPLRSVAYRILTSAANDSQRVAYWPLEEQSGATSIYSPYGGSVSYAGTINFGAITDARASERLLTFGSSDALMFFTLPDWTNTNSEHCIVATMKFPETELANDAIIYRLYFTGGNVDFVDLLYSTGGGTYLKTYYGGVLVNTSGIVAWGDIILNKEVVFVVTTDQNGANIDFRSRATTNDWWLVELTTTVPSRTLGRLFAITVGQTDISGLGFGQLAVGNNKDSFDNYLGDLEGGNSIVTGGRGYLSEFAGQRFLRLCEEEGIPAVLIGDEEDTQRMGPQGVDTIVNLLKECVRTDGGLMFEPRDDLALVMRTGRDLYNQASSLDLSFTGGQIAPTLQPVFDDQGTRNDVTVKRRNGSSARAVQETGPLNVNSPTDDPEGVGRYDQQIEVNTYTDDVLAGLANWYVHKGTVDEARYPQVTVDLDAAPSLATSVNALDIGDRITISDLPVDWSPDGASLLVLGIKESLPAKRRLVTLVTVPASPYEVGIVGASGGGTDLRGQAVDADSSTLATGINSTATSLSVATAGGRRWTTTSSDWNTSLHGGGLFIVIGGEVMRITNITGASSPQTFTVVRSINGVVKSHLAGAPVHVRYPAVVGL